MHYRTINSLLSSLSLANEDILEFGAGTGKDSLYLAQRHSLKSVTLVDFSPAILQSVSQNDFPCPLTKVFKNILAFQPKKQYGLVHSAGLIEHFTGSKRAGAVRKHAECVKPNGFVMIQVPVKSFAFSLLGKFNKAIGIQEIPLTEKELKMLCSQNGLKVLKENHLGFGSLYIVLAKKIK